MVIPQSLLRDFRKTTGNRLSGTGRRDLEYVIKSGRKGRMNLATVGLLPVIHEVHAYGSSTDAIFAEHVLHGVAMGLGMTKKEADRKPCPHCGGYHDEESGKLPLLIKKLIEEISKMA